MTVGGSCPVPKASACVEMAHGAGGRRSQQLIDRIFRQRAPRSSDPSAPGAGADRARQATPSVLVDGLTHDAAVLQLPLGLVSGVPRFAFTTDAYVVTPRFFPGGDIGKLAIVGTLNDLAMVGAEPLALTASFVLEEGLALDELSRIAQSMFDAASASRTQLVAGDTKVVERGRGDGVYISTTGFGHVAPTLNWSSDRIAVGDVVIVSGDIGRHGMTIMAARHELDLGPALVSDCAPLWPAVAALRTLGPAIACLRDATRGGLAAAVEELAQAASVFVELDERAVPVNDAVSGACELLGIDPLYLANEGRFVVFCRESAVDEVLRRLQAVEVSACATVVGRVSASDPVGRAGLRTALGPLRPLDGFGAEQLPRIC